MKAAVKTTQGQSVCWGGEGCSVTRPGRIFQLLCASWARQGWEFNNLGLEGTLLALGVPAPPGAPLCCAPVRIHHTHTHIPSSEQQSRHLWKHLATSPQQRERGETAEEPVCFAITAKIKNYLV